MLTDGLTPEQTLLKFARTFKAPDGTKQWGRK
jgi:hypothetical protein